VRTHRTDVLVLGSGGAGMRAAIEAAQLAEVTLVSKGPLGRSGATVLAGADVMADGASLRRLGFPDDPLDTPDKWAREIVIEGFALNEERLVDAYVEGAGSEIERLIDLGLTVRKTLPRAIITTGTSICSALRRGIDRHSDRITAIDNAMAIDLLLSDGRVVGALLLDIDSGEFVSVEARSTVLATGGWHTAYAFSAGPDEATGDGQAMAYRAGAELIDMEMVTFAPNILLAPPRYRGSLWFYILPGTLLNRNGDAFMAWEDPRVAKLALTSEWNKLLCSKASMREVLAGRGSPSGGVFFSMRHLPSNVWDALEAEHSGWRFQGDDFSDLMARMRDGVAAEVGPAAEYFEGGIRINERCETSIPGLYAAGECTGGLFGANRVSAATTEMLVEGKIAGHTAGLAAASKGAVPCAGGTHVEEEIAAWSGMLGSDSGPSVQELRSRLQKAAYQNVGVIRTGRQLNEAAKALEEIETCARSVSVQTARRHRNREWCEAIELRNMAQSVRLSALAALKRTESRGVHMREDYPITDNVTWRRHIVCRRAGAAPRLTFADVDSATPVEPEITPYDAAIVRAAEALDTS